MAEGADPVAREWQRALGLADCMVCVGGRMEIPEFEPVHMTPDTMSTAVEILWFRPPPPPLPPTGMPCSFTPVHWQAFCICL